ncbi:MAG TPA: acyltransferase [Candidatus Udaeobacter sp.]|jgi:peptidoglycan/LPS O-acetylase OafA/YrhL|nr:acyltransferase [Candidatus Udaeobacter sp.]
MTNQPTPTLQADLDPRFQDRTRQPGLDLLRALAIIVVVIYHAGIMGFPLPGRLHRWGWIGVDLFFVLSGYLIGGQLLAELARNRRLNLGGFYARRVLRIMPAYFAILAIYFLLPSWREYPDMAQPLWKFLASVQNVSLHGGTAFSHAWSLAVEDQFYLALPFLLLFLYCRPRAGLIIPCLIVFGGIALRAFLAAQNPSVDGGVSFRGFQAWIYYPTWTRLDPLVFGVVIAAIEKCRPQWWKRLTSSAIWLWLPALALIAFALYLGETENLTVTACIWQFPLIAIGMTALLICALSPRLPLRRFAIPGAAFIASIAYSAYLVQKLVIHGVAEFCRVHRIDPKSAPALIGVELCVYGAATLLFFAVERPFLQLRHRIVPRTVRSR